MPTNPPIHRAPRRWLRKIKLWHVLALIVTSLLVISPPWFIVQPSEMAGVRRDNAIAFGCGLLFQSTLAGYQR